MPATTQPTRYAVQWKGESRYGGANRLGETKQFGGHSYELQAVSGGAHRWVRVDREPTAQAQRPTAGEPTPPPVQNSAASNPGIASSGVDPAQAHIFTKSQLANIQGPAKGLMAALHAHPDVQGGGAVVSQSFAPAQVRQVHQWLSQNVGKAVGGGQAVDLGQGRFGFASPAGSIVVWPQDSSGKHQVKYTNQTGLVARSMGGQQAGPSGAVNPPANSPPSSRQGSNASPAAAPAMMPTPGPSGSAQMPAASKANPMPAPVQSAGENPFQRTPATSSANFEPTKATPEQMQSASALMERPAPQIPASPRAAADEAKSRLQSALAQWQDEVRGGLSPKGNARWRSYTAALRSMWQQHEQLARDDEKKTKAASKTAGKGSGGAGAALSDDEALAQKKAPDAFKQLQAMRDSFKNEDAYKDAVRQIAGSHDPWEGRKVKGGDEPQERPLLKPSDERSAMERVGIDPQTGKSNRPTKADKERQMREEARKGFSTPAQQQPAPLEGSDAWKATVRKQSEEWGMKPEDYNALAGDLYREVENHASERKNAYLTARKATGLSQADINKLENEGYDSGSQHKRIKQLDTLGRELAAEYPGLGWGRGREDEGNDEGNIDYAERVWALIRDGYKPAPGKMSPEFLDHVNSFLSHQQKQASNKPSGGEEEDLSAVPFAKVRDKLLVRYARWVVANMV